MYLSCKYFQMTYNFCFHGVIIADCILIYQASSFVIAYYLVMKHYGRALRRLLKEGEEKTMTLEQFEKMIEVWFSNFE